MTTLKVCFCGCGGLTNSKFVPGHDARFHGLAKKALRGEVEQEAALASLAHDEARAAFLAYQDKIAPAEAARAQERATEKARKDAAKAQRQADREAEAAERTRLLAEAKARREAAKAEAVTA